MRKIGSNEKFEICRLCGRKSVHYFPIFEEDDKYIPEKISRCLPIIILPTDNLPSNICKRCLHYLNISYKLVLTSVEIDNQIRMQLDQKQEDATSKDQDIAISYEKSKICTSTNTKILLEELQRRAITGPVQCDLCDLKFQDVDAFDIHMEQFHFLKWRCNLCDSSFCESNELIAHKISIHDGNIVLCNDCEHANDQNNKQEIIHEKNDQDMQQEITHEKNDQDMQQEIFEEKDELKEAIITSTVNKEIITSPVNKEIITSTVNKEIITSTVNKEIITSTVNKEVATSSINLAMQTENDTSEIKSKSSPVQTSMGQSDASSDSNTDEVIKKCNKPLDLAFKTLKGKEKKSMICNFCNIDFKDEQHFKAHNKIHKKRSITCIICHIECPSMYEVFLHKRAVHNMYKKVQLKYICDKCDKFFMNNWHWENHDEDECSNMADKLITNDCKCCKYCNTTFSSRVKLIHHLKIHKSEIFNDPTVTVYKCSACPKVFIDKDFYEKHKNLHNLKWDTFKCTICGRPFKDNFLLQRHQLAVHENIKPHQCDVCGHSFSRLHGMIKHRKIHFEQKCSHCNAVFKNKPDLIKHVQDTHSLELDIPKKLSSGSNKPSKGNYICKFCGKKLSAHQSLINHERIHTGETPFSCPICHQSFRSSTTKWAHIIRRHQKRTYVCDHCGKSFSYKEKLSKHIQTHLPVEARKYQCNVCGKKFTRSCQLAVHKRIHDGIRPFKCDVCFLNFSQKAEMKRHRMRHFKHDIQAKNLKNLKNLKT